jgi:hypothetical protein
MGFKVAHEIKTNDTYVFGVADGFLYAPPLLSIH